MSGRLDRRGFLKAAAMAAVGLAAASCAQPTPQVIEKEVPVEKVVKETVVVQKEVAVEKVVTATPKVSKYKEAPALTALVQAGKLPPVDERVSEEPMVITPWEEIGQYGGTWHRLATSPTDIQVVPRLNYNQIIRWDKDGANLIPNVVTSWEVNKDNTEFTFHLRKGMKWSDGHPYTSADMAFSVEDVWTNKDLTPTLSSYWKRGGEPAKLTVLDDYNYKLTFAASYPLFLYYAAGANIVNDHQRPKHYLQQFHPTYADKDTLDKLTKEAGLEFWYQLFGNKFNMTTNPDLPVIGAWMVTVPPPKQPVVHERNPFYWKVDPEGHQLPYIDRIEHMIVQDSKQAQLRAVAGEVDMQYRHMLFDNYTLFQENKEKGDYRVLLGWEKGGRTDNAFWFNYEHEDPVLRDILRDKRFRYACSLGINRQEIIDGVFMGVGEPTQVCPPASSPFYWDEWATWMTEHDPDRANAYLDEMGLTQRDSEGYRLRPDGKRLSVIFEYTISQYAFQPQAELMAAHWKDLGIELILNGYERTLWEERMNSGKFDMSTWGTGTTYNPIIRRDWFACKFRPYDITYYRWHTTGGKEGIEAPKETRIEELYQLDDQFEATSDMDEWKRIVRQMLEIQKDQLHYIGVSTEKPELVIVKNSFRNVPETCINDTQLATEGNTMPEQYFIKS